METEQIDKRVSWLDEQRRRDAEELTRLEEKLESLDQSARQHSKQLRDLAGELARISALEARIRQFDETIAKHRSEILQQLETQDERQIAREKALESLRGIDQKKVGEEIDELRAQLREFGPIKDALEARKREELRVSRAVDQLDKMIGQVASEEEDGKRALVGVREARERDAQRIIELENESSNLNKGVEELRGLLDSTQDQVRKLVTRAEILEVGEKELRQSQALWTEQQAARLAEFERAWDDWERRFAEFEIQSDELQDRMESYEETHRGLRLLRDDLKDVVERLDRRIAEVSEIQRLSEDRFIQEWSTFQADERKRWSSFKLSSEEQWKVHQREHQIDSERLRELEHRLENLLLKVDEIDALSRGRISDLVRIVQEWGAELRDGNA